MKRDIVVGIIIGSLLTVVLGMWSEDWDTITWLSELFVLTFLSTFFMIGTDDWRKNENRAT